MAEPTPPQTVGPFFSIGLPWDDGPEVVARSSDGAIALRGAVYDGEGAPVPDAIVESSVRESRVASSSYAGYDELATQV